MDAEPDMSGVERRPRSHDSLIHAAPRGRAGTLVAQSIGGGVTVTARQGRTIVFGRQADEVHVCVGPDDLGMSRKHGVLTCDNAQWWVSNVGRRPIRLQSGELFPHAEPVCLAPGYTPLFVTGAQGRQHLLELYVSGPEDELPRARPHLETLVPTAWPLNDDELIAMVVLGQRYLYLDPNPQPLSWQQAADELRLVDPDGGWTAKRLEHKVVKVRDRISRRGVSGLMRSEVSQPVGNQLNDNLIRELVRTMTIVPTDLARLDRYDG